MVSESRSVFRTTWCIIGFCFHHQNIRVIDCSYFLKFYKSLIFRRRFWKGFEAIKSGSPLFIAPKCCRYKMEQLFIANNNMEGNHSNSSIMPNILSHKLQIYSSTIYESMFLMFHILYDQTIVHDYNNKQYPAKEQNKTFSICLV